MENQVRFNSMRSKKDSQYLEWFFLIINRDKGEISRIKNSIYDLFAPIVEEGKTYSGQLQNRLNYLLIDFNSEKKLDSGWKPEVFRRIFKDNDLYLREKDADGLEKYISEIDKKIKI